MLRLEQSSIIQSCRGQLISLCSSISENHKANLYLRLIMRTLRSQGLGFTHIHSRNYQRISMCSKRAFSSHVLIRKLELTGYQVGNDWAPNKVWQLNLAQREGQSIHQVRSMHQTASEIDHQYYPPTSFVADNLIYKYLDSNLFAVSTLSSDSSVL